MKNKKTNPDFFYQAELRNSEFIKNFPALKFQKLIKYYAAPTVGDMKDKDTEEIAELILHLPAVTSS